MTCSTSYLYYTLIGPWNVHMHIVCVCVSNCSYVNMYDTMSSRSVSTSTSIVPPDTLPLSLSIFTPVKTPDPQPPNISAHP